MIIEWITTADKVLKNGGIEYWGNDICIILP